uniref:Thioredoxin-like fold domain-containing protein n=1 Tax=Acrobeloides nanus TaxID=290746 RepID=A0A914C9E3_9BILA
MLVGQLAIVDAALFTGAATYISHSEQPSRLKADDRALLTEFKESYPRGTQMQAPLAAVGALLGLLQWLIYGGNLWFLGAIIIFSNWPFTYVVIMPLNKTLMSIPSNSGNAESRKLIQKWGQYHLVRAGLGLASTLVFLNMACDCIPSIGQVITTLVTFYSLKFAYSYYKACCCSKQAPKLQKQDWKKDVVYLYQFPRSSFIPNLSPFCLKLEAFLRLHEIKYEPIFTFSGRSKKGLLPFIELNGEHIADSQIIILHLKKYFNIQDKLTNEQKAVERAFDRLIESTFFK